jgi:hypothetical protein
LKPDCNMKIPHPLWADPVEAEALKVRLDDQHRQKIRLADRVLVVGDYAGDSTRGEIAYARELGKPVRSRTRRSPERDALAAALLPLFATERAAELREAADVADCDDGKITAGDLRRMAHAITSAAGLEAPHA